MEAQKQNLGGLDATKKPSVEAATQEPTNSNSNLPRMDVSGYGAWGAKVDESRDLADKHGLTEDIAKMAVSGKTAIEIAQAMKERLEAVNPAVEGENPLRENSNFVRRVRTSLGVPSAENAHDEALFNEWKAKAESRLYGPPTSEAPGIAPENPNPSTDTGKATPETIVIDQATKDRLAGLRARDAAQVQDALGLNSIEPDIERKRQTLDDEKEEAKRAAWLKKADQTQQEAPLKKASDNKVESDEVFTATQEAKPLVPKEVERQYLRVGDKYYHPKNADVLAFEDKGNKLETRSNSEQIAESMVRIAQAGRAQLPEAELLLHGDSWNTAHPFWYNGCSQQGGRQEHPHLRDHRQRPVKTGSAQRRRDGMEGEARAVVCLDILQPFARLSAPGQEQIREGA